MPSQYGQDHLVLQLLGGKRGGYFLDTGAADGIRSSNSELLEKYFGWNGLCVEPNARFFDNLVRVRRCTCLNACLYDSETDLPFLEAAGTLGGLVDTFEPGQLEYTMHMKGLKPDAAGRPPLVTKRTMTIEAALDRAGAPPVIDYWSLDTEGSELLLLQSFPFARYTFNVLTVEHNLRPARHAIRHFLESRGFDFFAELVIDDCYVRRAALPHRHAASAAWRRRWRSS